MDIGYWTTELRAARVERSRVRITVPARIFDAKSLLKILITTLLTLLLAIIMWEMFTVMSPPVAYAAAVPVIKKKDPGVGPNLKKRIKRRKTLNWSKIFIEIQSRK